MNLRGLVSLCLMVACVGPAFADDAACAGRSWSRWWLYRPVCPSLCGSPDDYCKKPCPPLAPFSRCGGPDDYCRKPFPCVTTVPCGGVDDYCRKSLPCLLCPPASPYLHDGSGQGCGVPHKHR